MAVPHAVDAQTFKVKARQARENPLKLLDDVLRCVCLTTQSRPTGIPLTRPPNAVEFQQQCFDLHNAAAQSCSDYVLGEQRDV